MTSLERTAYPRFSRAPSVKELRELYTPTPHAGFQPTTKEGACRLQGQLVVD